MSYKLLALFIGLLISCYTDYKFRKIKNWVVGTLLLFGLILTIPETGGLNIKYLQLTFQNILAGILFCFVSLRPFIAAKSGAGDIKLIFAAGFLIGLSVDSVFTYSVSFLASWSITGLASRVVHGIKNPKPAISSIKTELKNVYQPPPVEIPQAPGAWVITAGILLTLLLQDNLSITKLLK